ncbi:S8 family serine peptidase [Streptomyces sp. NPDC048279]|uniref:S8 family serine peptidase n=1 Tax=Streptomyces sp. NPDC048279 TaxID=3154714 RepID=UPI00342B19A5
MRRFRPHLVPATLILVLVTVLSAVGQRAAADGSVTLPSVRTRLAAGQPCVTASGRKAKAQTWAQQALGLSRTWQLTQGAGVTVAVVDTGVGTSVPALAGRVEAVGEAGRDCVGHGSFAAGLIAAAPLSGTGVVGVAPQARILALRGTDERGATTPSTVARAIRDAADRGAEVIYAAQTLLDGRQELTDAVDYAARKDAMVVAPAAPDTAPENADSGQPDTTARPYFPAFIPQVLSVSDYGPNGSRAEQAPSPFAPDLAAPGDLVVSVGPRGPGHFIGSGSSFAAAYVAGAVVLVRARHPEMTAAQVIRQVQGTAYPAAPPLLDPFAAVSAVLPDRQPSASPPALVRIAPSAPTTYRRRALAVAGGAASVALLVAAAAVIVPRGRVRRWRPGAQ